MKRNQRLSGAGSPVGGWKRSTMASRISLTPVPSFALARMAVLLSSPMMSSIWRLHSSGCALGRSILLMTGMMSRLSSTARYAFASVCASTPCAASTSRSAPSQAARERGLVLNPRVPACRSGSHVVMRSSPCNSGEPGGLDVCPLALEVHASSPAPPSRGTRAP